MGNSSKIGFASKKSIRMCICCRRRLLQSDLLRLCVTNDEVGFFAGFGRSFYLCCDCSKRPKVEEKIARIKKLHAHNQHKIKEIIALWESQSKNSPQS